jgi:hypothetical protein
MRYMLGLAILLALTSCTSRADQMAADDSNCKSYGYKPGTPEYANCRMNLDTHRGDRRALKQAAIIVSQ